MTTHARRLLREVHELARAYHWSEADILRLDRRRRRRYLALLESDRDAALVRDGGG